MEKFTSLLNTNSMQIAENLVKQGMIGDTRFNDELTSLIELNGLTKVIETGTYHGTGTTKAIIKGLSRLFHPYEFYSIEANPTHHKEAVKNIGQVNGVTLLLGLSVSYQDRPYSITLDLPDFVIVDHHPDNRTELYTKEVSYQVPDNMIEFALAKFDHQPDLVMLDSAGHMGFIEFKYLMSRVKGSFYLALDDTDHVKHYETMLYIKDHPEQFEIIKHVHSKFVDPIHGSKFGYAIIKVDGL